MSWLSVDTGAASAPLWAEAAPHGPVHERGGGTLAGLGLLFLMCMGLCFVVAMIEAGALRGKATVVAEDTAIRVAMLARDEGGDEEKLCRAAARLAHQRGGRVVDCVRGDDHMDIDIAVSGTVMGFSVDGVGGARAGPEPSALARGLGEWRGAGNGDPGESGVGASGMRAVREALSLVGSPYAFGGDCSDPFGTVRARQCDCSSLTQRAWRVGGVALPRTAHGQSFRGTRVAVTEIRAGDLLFSRPGDRGRRYGHVALAISPTMAVHAPRPGKVVQTIRIDHLAVVEIRRVTS